MVIHHKESYQLYHGQGCGVPIVTGVLLNKQEWPPNTEIQIAELDSAPCNNKQE